MTTEASQTDQQWLDQLKENLSRDYDEQTARLAELTADTGDPSQTDTQRALVATTRQSLEQISAALQRISEGRYGYCDDCGQPIPRERLEAIPYARYCVPCQSRRS